MGIFRISFDDVSVDRLWFEEQIYNICSRTSWFCDILVKYLCMFIQGVVIIFGKHRIRGTGQFLYRAVSSCQHC